MAQDNTVVLPVSRRPALAGRAFLPAFDHRRRIALLVSFGPGQPLRADQSDLDGRGCDVHVSVGEGLGGKPERHRILGPGAAELLRQPDTQHAELTELAQDVERELGGRGAVTVAGKQDLAGEVGKGLLKCRLIRSELERNHLWCLSTVRSTWRLHAYLDLYPDSCPDLCVTGA